MARLACGAWINPGIGFAVASLAAAWMRLVYGDIAALLLIRPHSLIWIAASWRIRPASPMMRGGALRQIAALIEAERRDRSQEGDGGA